MSSKHSAGKGDTYRYVDHDKYSKNYDLILSKISILLTSTIIYDMIIT